MDAYAPRHCVVWLCVSVCDFLFVNPRQPVRVVVVVVGVELPQKADYMLIERGVTGFPSERHYYMLVDERGVSYDTRFLVLPLIERDGYSAYFLLYVLFVLCAPVIRFDPRLLYAVGINKARNCYRRYVRGFVSKFDIGNQREQ